MGSTAAVSEGRRPCRWSERDHGPESSAATGGGREAAIRPRSRLRRRTRHPVLRRFRRWRWML